jgi:D-alanine-D-alanine ligase
LTAGGFDRVFVVLHGRGGEDGTVQGALELLGLPYTGSGVLGSALGMDKYRCKMIWRGLNLPTPEFLLMTSENELEKLVNWEYPLIMKPVHEGSSIGISRVDEPAGLRAAWAAAKGYDGQVLVERWIHGAEYTAGILAGKPLSLIRVETPRKFFDYEAKYHEDSTRYYCPCGLDGATEGRLQQLALAAFEAIGGRGWGRVDMLLDREGQPWLIEVNTIPGMTDHSLVPMAARQAGLAFDDLVLAILATTLEPAP